VTERITYLVQKAQGANTVGYEVKREDASKASRTNITHMPDKPAQERAIEIAKEFAEEYWEERGILAQVLVRRVRDTEEGDAGTFREEATYGMDPEEIEG
jgi:hypothetical protein